MENQNTPEVSLTEQSTACESCRYWTRRIAKPSHYLQDRRLFKEEMPSIPTKYGYCSSKHLYRVATSLEVNTPTDLFNEYGTPIDPDDLDIDLFTHQDFGCRLHEPGNDVK